ncbi:hydrogenase maturation nickel metallochaperone HypA [Litorilinea aerophila]|nr:hydrogenase maturation nickel metallochaperone HypA [Litorilinea aerophila]MCC9078947.1 hydrogenase maturation nickel metallochaperone HypA [Litorilinea aerophila]OUC08548.1 hypothetical protein RY27_08290 [Litorilinea aerophila]GIV77612.1 MAG: putative hydrogenase nickel incorporation protein HypA [Litorilinea sp.]
MHELAITQHLLDLTLAHARAAQARKVTHLYLVIGQLSSIVDDSVQFYWEQIARGTLAADAQLHFRRVPAWLQCQGCGAETPLDAQADFRCPVCKSPAVQVVGGDEFRLESIEVE